MALEQEGQNKSAMGTMAMQMLSVFRGLALRVVDGSEAPFAPKFRLSF